MLNLLSLIALVIAITIHEYSHALVADLLGDPTPRSYGRLTLNPIAHADPIGTLALPLLSAFTGIPTIGWAKPVPVDPYNFRVPRRDEILVSLAGPASNLILAVLTALFIRFTGYASNLLYIIVLINLSLAIFNLIPLWPLDGSKILLNLVPLETASDWEDALQRYSTPLLLIALFIPFGSTTLLSAVITPPIRFLSSLLLGV